MIKLSNGHELEFVAASGALGFDGTGYWWEKPLKLLNMFDTSLFTPITKTITYLKQPGNCGRYNFKCVKFLKDGILNSMGLNNPGIYKWIEKNSNYNGIVSIYPGSEYTLVNMLRILNELKNIKAIELNISCPNLNDSCMYGQYSTECLLRRAKKETRLPLIIKINLQQDINLESVEKYVAAISINSVPWNVIFDTESPLKEYGGGAVSGKIAQECNWKFIKQLINKTSIPVIGADVWEYEDISRLYNMGCKAIGFGSLFLKYPWKPTVYVRRYNKSLNGAL